MEKVFLQSNSPIVGHTKKEKFSLIVFLSINWCKIWKTFRVWQTFRKCNTQFCRIVTYG